MDSIYISLGASDHLLEFLVRKTGFNPGFAGHKFGRLLINGFKKNGVDMKVLSALAMNRSMSKKILWNIPNEEDNGIYYKYIPFLNLPFIQPLGIIVYTFFFVLFWGIKHKKERFIFIDIINTGLCIGALAAAKINGMRIIGCMTDMPGLMVESSTSMKEKSFYARVAHRINKGIVNKFDAYVFLTQQMNKVVNTKNRPYIIMEGLVDSDITPSGDNTNNPTNEVSFFYAGGLHKRYGLGMLVDAFHKLPYDNCRLVLYGSGPYVDELKEISSKDPRIEYRGLAPNEEVVKEEKKATILVNPRPTNEEFTQYSFPSKNMEYMASGRPLLTTKLPGMPNEYYDYVFLFEEESTDGYYKTLDRMINTQREELDQKGVEAQKWVLKNKNNIVQTKRIIDLVRSI